MEELVVADAETLVRQSLALKDQADRLLREFRVREQLQPFGDVELAGSYSWDLMTHGDLDFYVVNPHADLAMALDALAQFVRRGDFLRFGFIDSVRGVPPWQVPEGYFLGMAREFGGQEWKVETWFLRAPLPRPAWITERMTEERRHSILRLKHLRNAGHLKATSYQIYQAVLLGGAWDAAGVRAWLEAEPRHTTNDLEGGQCGRPP